MALVELAAFLWALGDLPVALGGAGEVVLGPEPWFLLSVPPFQIFMGSASPHLGFRWHLWMGPWFLWIDLPPPRLALARSPGHALVALVRDFSRLYLAWEIFDFPGFSLFGSLGGENALGMRFRLGELWLSGLIKDGRLSLWCGFYF
jgi:hypothetical protein